MLPEFKTFQRLQIFWQWIGITLISALLMFALWRNSQTFSQLQLLLGTLAIVGGISFAVLRDQPGYWVYATLSLKFMLSSLGIEKLQGLNFGKKVQSVSPLQRPFTLPVILMFIIGGLVWAGLRLFPEHSIWVMSFSILALFPLLLCILVLSSAPYFVILASAEGEAIMLQGTSSKRRVSHYLGEDVFISLALTYVLIWPLQNHPAFTLEQGYANSHFILAALFLCLTAAFFMLLGARRSRLMSHVGERLSALFVVSPVRKPSPLSSCSLALRALLYSVGLVIWTLTLCLTLANLWPSAPFVIFALLLLPALGTAYSLERQLCLSNDSVLAQQFIDEMQIAAASVSRRSPVAS